MVSMIKFGSGRGRLAKAARFWADSVRSSSDLPGSVLILVELARDAACLADAARREGDGRLYLSAAARLQQLVDRVDRSAGRDGGGAGPADDEWSREMAELLRSGPEVRDGEDG